MAFDGVAVELDRDILIQMHALLLQTIHGYSSGTFCDVYACRRERAYILSSYVQPSNRTIMRRFFAVENEERLGRFVWLVCVHRNTKLTSTDIQAYKVTYSYELRTFERRTSASDSSVRSSLDK